MDILTPEDRSKSGRQVFQAEQPLLIVLPDNPYLCYETEAVSVGKTPYIRFDLNDYSVPHNQVRKTLTVQATVSTVTILYGIKIIATHNRSYDKAQQIKYTQHIDALAAQKKHARLHRSQHRLTHSIECTQDFLNASVAHGYFLDSTVRQLLRLLDDYGAATLNTAMLNALKCKVPHPNSVRVNLQRILDEQQQQPKLSTLFLDKRVNALTVKPHNLSSYEVLNYTPTKEE